jgi:hypothetical protein
MWAASKALMTSPVARSSARVRAASPRLGVMPENLPVRSALGGSVTALGRRNEVKTMTTVARFSGGSGSLEAEPSPSPYVAPSVTYLGTLRELTQGGGTGLGVRPGERPAGKMDMQLGNGIA